MFDRDSLQSTRRYLRDRIGLRSPLGARLEALSTRVACQLVSKMPIEMSRTLLFADVPEVRRRLMRAIQSRDTKPEIALRSVLHKDGLRFRLGSADLPGRPDLVFRSRKVAIFMNGCFWHAHAGCPRFSLPKTRQSYWQAKLNSNVARDAKVHAALRSLGWRVVVLWECEAKAVWPAKVRAAAGLATRKQ